MADHTEQLVGVLFRILSEEGYIEARQALLNRYQSQATAERKELTKDLFSELITVLNEQVTTQTQISILTTAVNQLLNRFTAVIEAAPVAMFVVDERGNIQVWNDSAEKVFGWSHDEVRQQPYSQLFHSSSEVITEFLNRLQNGEQLSGIEAQHSHKDGTVIDVQIWAAPIPAEDGPFSGAVFIISDITEQKQREQRLTVLNRVLRHNIRNDITIIQGHLDMLANDLPEQNRHIQTMDKHLSEITELSHAARNIERLQNGSESERVTIDLRAMLRERVNRLRGDPRSANISTELSDSLQITAHELLPYAFDNILDNAVEHNNSETPKIVVSTECDKSQNRVIVAIEDNGPGLPSMERQVLSSGTETSLEHSSGMGLWLTHWIVRSSDGSITVGESELGGTRVSVQLRRVPSNRRTQL